ncbi:integrase [Polaromonas sp. CG_9.5]|uniref:DUF6538 domain-containing protein n=1 Tax=Polaromonas sp. CG_9.5 TaxID=3071705 RepID=UPI002E019F00|nr:integrase [Polaromonas sp. CG_9.5]
MHLPHQPSSTKSSSVDGDDYPSSTLTDDRPSPFGEVDPAHSIPAPTNQVGIRPWQPRQHSRHLFKSANGTWYFRLTVPAAIRAQYPELPKELKRSTETANKRVAESRAREMCIEFSIRYTTGASMPTPDLISNESFAIVYNNGNLGLKDFHGASPATLSLMTKCFQLMTQQICAQTAKQVDGPNPPGASILDLAPREQSNSILIPAVVKNHHIVETGEAGTNVIWLSDAIDDWRKNGSGRFSQVTWGSVYSPSFRVFREIVSNQRRDRETDEGVKVFGILDIPLHQLTRQHIQMLRQDLQELPPNQGKRTNDTEAMERIAEGRKQKSKPPSRGSVAKKLGHIGGFMEYCKRKAWITIELLDEYKLAVEGAWKDASQESDKKTPGYVALNTVELKKLYEQPAFLAGAVAAAWRYWVPLICLHQGCRVSEASQLFTDDITLRDDVPCISFINDETSDEEENDNLDAVESDKTSSKKKRKTYKTVEEFRRLKTKSSRRVVPIHPKLIELGFLNFVKDFDSISSRSQHLFSDLRWEEKSMFGRYPSQHIIALLKECSVWVKRKKVGHSLRSNFKQEIEKTGLSENLQQRLLGHSPNTMKDKHYNETDDGPAYPAAQVLPFLAAVDFQLKLPSWADVEALVLANARAKGLARMRRRKAHLPLLNVGDQHAVT